MKPSRSFNNKTVAALKTEDFVVNSNETLPRGTDRRANNRVVKRDGLSNKLVIESLFLFENIERGFRVF